MVCVWIVVAVGLFLIWLVFRSGGYKREPLDAPRAATGRSPENASWTPSPAS
jgi:hypothetical protein